MERPPNDDRGDAGVRPAADITNTNTSSNTKKHKTDDIAAAKVPAVTSVRKKRFPGLMRSRSGDPARVTAATRASLMEQQFNSIRHLMDEEDEASPKTAGQWSQRLQTHLKSKFERGPSSSTLTATATITATPTGNTGPKVNRTRTWSGTGSPSNLHVNTTSTSLTASNNVYDGEASSPDILFQQQPPEQPEQPYQQPGSSSASRLQILEQSFTTESIVGGWFSSTKRRTSSSANPNNSSRTDSLVGSNSSLQAGADILQVSSGRLEMSAREIFRIGSNASGDIPHASSQSPTPTTPTRRRIFRTGGPVLAPKLAKQLTDFRRKRSGKFTTKDDIGDANDDGDFSVTTEKLSAHSKHITLTDEDLLQDDDSMSSDSDADNNNDGDGQKERVKSYKPHPQSPNRQKVPRHPRQLKTGKGGERNASAETAEVQQQEELVEWRREKFKDKLAGKTETSPSSKAAIAPKSISSAAALLLLAETNHTGSDSSSNDEVLMVEQKSLDSKIKATGKKPNRKKSDSTKKSLALSLASSEASARAKITDFDEDTRTVLDDLFDDDDSVFFDKAKSGKNKDAPISTTHEAESSSPNITTTTDPSILEKPDRIARARTASATTIESKSMFASTRTTVSPDYNSRSQGNERTLEIRGSSIRSQRSSSGGSIRSQRSSGGLRAELDSTAHPNTNSSTIRSERTLSSRSDRTTSHRTERTNTSVADCSEEDLASIFENIANHRKPRRRASSSSVDDFDKSFQIVDGAFHFGASESQGFEAFTTNADKDTTQMFHRSFAVDALLSPLAAKRSSGSSMPNIVTDGVLNALEASFALSTVDEMSKSSRDDKAPKRRNSLPTGSSHNTAIQDELIGKPKRKSSNPNRGAAATRSTTRNRRRHSTTASDLLASIAQLQTSDLNSDAKTRSAEPELTVRNKEHASPKNSGLASPPADKKRSARRRTSVSEKIVQELKGSHLDQIRNRRRVTHRILTSGEIATKTTKKKSSRKLVTTEQTDETAQTSTIVWQRRSPTKVEAVPGKQPLLNEQDKTRRSSATEIVINVGRKERKVTRRQTRDRTREVKPTNAFSQLLRRTMTEDGRTSKSARTTKNEGTKKITRGHSPNSSRRLVRRQTVQLDAPLLPTCNEKERSRSRRSLQGADYATTDTIWHDGLNSSMQGEGIRRTLPISPYESHTGEKSGRPRRQISLDDQTQGSRSIGSDDSSFAPTPKPAAPPSLPILPVRKSTGKRAGEPTGLKPRRKKSAEDALVVVFNQTAIDPAADPTMTPTNRRPGRNRRNTAHEALKKHGMDFVLTPAPGSAANQYVGNTSSITARLLLAPPQNKSKKSSSKERSTKQKNLVTELVGSPDQANRCRRTRRASSTEEGSGATRSPKTSTLASSTKQRRSKSDDGADYGGSTKWLRNYTISGRSQGTRRAKTTDGAASSKSTAAIAKRNDFVAVDGNTAASTSNNYNSNSSSPDGPEETVSNRPLLQGLSF